MGKKKKRFKNDRQGEMFKDRTSLPTCYYCGKDHCDIWSGLLQSSVHSSCYRRRKGGEEI